VAPASPAPLPEPKSLPTAYPASLRPAAAVGALEAERRAAIAQDGSVPGDGTAPKSLNSPHEPAAPFVFAERRSSEALDRLAGLVTVRRERQGAVISLQSDRLVEPGQWAITPRGQTALEELAPGLRDQEGHTIFIRAYTDSQGTAAVNDALSLRRAEAVRDFLATKGVAAENMRPEGLGARRPLGDNSTPDGRAQNRRIEIVITK
jgi:outer membrane protein OmpA-like peptidoglycan-associated protein